MLIYTIEGKKYTTATELKQFLGYKGDKSILKLCRLNHDLLGDILVHRINQLEGGRMTWRVMTLFDAKQVGIILGISRFARASHLDEVREAFGEEGALDTLVPRRELLLLQELQVIFEGVAEIRYQQKFGPYYVDFLFPEHNLIVEQDGPEHLTTRTQVKDAAKEAYLAALGYRILRIRHEETDRGRLLNQILRVIIDGAPEKK